MHYKKFFKGEKIFLQNSFYEGIFLLTDGTIKISTNISIDEMKNLMTNLTYSLNNFQDYVSSFNTEKIAQQNTDKDLHNIPKDLNDLFYKRDAYDLVTIKEYNIIGTNETYNSKTQLYNFTCECISDSCVVYFYPKSHLNNLLNKEKEVYNSFIHLVEFRIKDIIWKMKKHISIFEREIKYQKFNRVKTINNYIEKENIKHKIISRNEKYTLNKNIFLTNNNINQIQTLYSNNLIYDSKSYFNSDIKVKNIKKIFIENEKNKESNNTERNNRINFRNKNKLKIPLIFSNTKKEKNEHNVSKSQIKLGKNKYMPNIFPYIIIDSKNKNEMIKNRYVKNNRNINPIKTIGNISSLKLKKLFINNNQL